MLLCLCCLLLAVGVLDAVFLAQQRVSQGRWLSAEEVSRLTPMELAETGERPRRSVRLGSRGYTVPLL